MLKESNILKFLDENKKIGGIFGFISNEEYILNGLLDNNDFVQFMFYYVGNNLNHFYYYFLGNFEKKIRNEILKNKSFNLDRFLVILHFEIYNVYIYNVYGKEKELWRLNGKSIDKTIERILKNYDPLYLIYLKDKGYGQLAELCFDIYLYYSFLGNSYDEFNLFINNYKRFLESEWKPIDFTSISCNKNWDYNTFFKVEQNRNIY
jgi:hypothetical protein